MSIQKQNLSKGLRTRHGVFLWLRIIIGLFISISLIIFGCIWMLSAGHVVPGDWSIILPIAFAVLGVVLEIYQWLFPVSSTSEKPTNSIALIKAKELHPENFNLGDDTAAKFQYVTEPVQDAYNTATRLLRNINLGTKVAESGFLVIGESNAGKTRLALEALTATLPEWLVLQWNPSYSLQEIPTSQLITKRDVVIFIDDIQKYINVEKIFYEDMNSSNIKIDVIHVLLNRLREYSRRTIVIATCREEDEIKVRAKIIHFFETLKIIRIKRFNPNPLSMEAKSIIHKFESKGAKYREDWDGTIGSLILGLARKKSLYDNLILHNELGTILLRAMKLLTLAGITTHTDRLLKAVSAKVFGAKEFLQDEKIWRATVEQLKLLQFIRLRVDNHSVTLAIRKDIYFEEIINDYNKDHAEQDFISLQQVLEDLEDTKALFNLGTIYLSLKWYKEVVSLASTVLKLDPNDASLWILKGLPYRAIDGLDQPLEALTAFNQALALQPNNAFALQFRGIAHGALGQYENALSDLNSASALNMDNAITRAFKGLAFEGLGRFQEALVILDQALELDPTNLDAWCTKSSVLRSLKRPDEALAALDQALSLEPFNADLWNDKAFTHKDLSQLEESFVAFNRSLELNPTSIVTWHGKAKISIELGKDEEALIALDHALALSPNDIDVLYDKGLVFMLLERYEEAILVWKHIIEVDSKHIDAWHFLGVVLRYSKHYKEAIIALDHALILDPNDSDIWFNKGVVLGVQEQYQEALLVLDHTLVLDPDNANIWFFKGMILNTLGKKEEAVSALTEALNLDPNDADKLAYVGTLIRSLEPFKKTLVSLRNDKGTDSELEKT